MEKVVEPSGDPPPPYKPKASNVSFSGQPPFQKNNQGEGEAPYKKNWDDECCLGCSKRCCCVSGILMGVIALILLILVILGILWFQSEFSPNSDGEQKPPEEGLMCACNRKGNSKCKASESPPSSDGAGDGERNCKTFGFCLWEEGKDGKVKRDCGKSDSRHEYGCLKIDGVTRCICECPRCNKEKPYDDKCWGTDCSKDESNGNSTSTSTNSTSLPSSSSSMSTDKPQRPPKNCYDDASDITSKSSILLTFILSTCLCLEFWMPLLGIKYI